jgi:hypothetical protein
MTGRSHSPAGDATAAFVSWLVTGAVGPTLVALPVNLMADKLAGAAVRWFRRLRQTDDLSRLVQTAAETSVQLSRDEIKALRKLLTEKQTWRLLAEGKLNEKLQELTSKIADCLPQRDGRIAEEAAGPIARGLLEFAVYDLQPEIFQKVVLARLQQMTDQAGALDEALFRMHKDLYQLVDDMKELFQQVSDRLPLGPADLNEIRIYLNAMIGWLNTDPWPQDLRLGGPRLTPAVIERKLRVAVTRPASLQDTDADEQDIDADELAQRCHRLVILGGPGTGKTWLAMRTARICAEQALTALGDGAGLNEVELPLYTTCARLIGTPGGIRQAAVSSAIEWIGDLGGARIIQALCLFFTERDTRTLLVIDSLDEASDPRLARDRLRQADSLMPPWRVVLTGRPSTWNNQFTIENANQDHQVGELQPLRYPDDIDRVIGCWFAGNPERGQALATQIAARPSLQQAATVPLILAFYCILGGQQPLPEFRHKLYEQVINRMLGGPWRSGNGPAPDMDVCRQTLRAWAWAGAKNHPVSGIGQWEDDIPTRPAQLDPAGQIAVDHVAAPRSGADFDTDETTRRFAHRAIREHLVAEYVANLSAKKAVKATLPHLWYDPDWEYAAPAAIAMHAKHDEVLRTLLCRASRSEEMPSDLSVIDAGAEVRKLLARVAAESREDDWSIEVATIIGQARVELARSDIFGDVCEAVHWPTSNRQVRSVLLERVAVALGRIESVPEHKPQARETLVIALTLTAEGPGAVEHAIALTRPGPTPEDKRQARETPLRLLTSGILGVVEKSGALARLEPAPEDKRQARKMLLDRLARTLSQFDPASEDKRQARGTPHTWLLGDGVPHRSVVRSLVAALARLDPTPEDKRQAREALLRLLTSETYPWVNLRAGPRTAQTTEVLAAAAEVLAAALAEVLVIALARLDPTPKDKRQARGTLLEQLPRSTSTLGAELLVTALVRLDPTPEDRRQAREALLEGLAHTNEERVANNLADALARLDPAVQDLDTWRTWPTPPTAELLAAVRRDSPVDEWLVALPTFKRLPS